MHLHVAGGGVCRRKQGGRGHVPPPLEHRCDHHLDSKQHPQEKGISFHVQHLQSHQHSPLGVQRADHRSKWLKVALSHAVVQGLVTSWLQGEDAESWHQVSPHLLVSGQAQHI